MCSDRRYTMLITQAVILCGGLGSRLGDLTKDTPKPMMSLGEKSFLDHLIQEISRYGFEEILLLAGYHGDQIYKKYNNTLINGCNITVSVEPQLLGTAGCLHYSKDLLQDYFVLMNGDSWLDFDLLKIREINDYPVNIVVKNSDNSYDCGVFTIEHDVVIDFLEKSKLPVPGLINSGIYSFKKSVIMEYVTAGVPASLEKDVLPKLIKSNLVKAKIADNNSYFIDIGTPDRYEQSKISFVKARTRPALFLDRDGTLNVDDGYTHRVSDLIWIDGAKDLIKHANSIGMYVFVVTNQAGVAKGKYSKKEVDIFHKHMQNILNAEGAHIDAFEYCPHHPEGSVAEYAKICDMRKPNPGMILKLASEWCVDLNNSLIIGDSDTDVIAGERAGIAGYKFSDKNLYDFFMGIKNDC